MRSRKSSAPQVNHHQKVVSRVPDKSTTIQNSSYSGNHPSVRESEVPCGDTIAAPSGDTTVSLPSGNTTESLSSDDTIVSLPT